ncbi:hypothetical protein [Saccharibacillus kuerlensis]|uniref:Uncharacterized protein n=1 Tax=Saccharibacillus kuerlensis TaxID=459527 RepID=A0ABQ2L0R5_9BACL|nr:hypothetical protein [Saccharibacillus kuerlensis]GGN98607.1 hypothetical protein GCM10010969_17890 [Saccharibacillus kuerlensis]
MNSKNRLPQKALPILLMLSLTAAAAGCDSKPGPTEATAAQTSSLYEAPNIDQSRVNPPQPPIDESPVGSPEHWEYGDTHSHPYEGTLVSYEMDGSRLVSLDFKPTSAILTSTNPVDIIAMGREKMNTVSTFPVRGDLDEPGTLNQRQMKHLVKGGTYIVNIDLWVASQDSFLAAQIPKIYYAKGDQFYSLADDSPFTDCTGAYNECRRLTP